MDTSLIKGAIDLAPLLYYYYYGPARKKNGDRKIYRLSYLFIFFFNVNYHT